jgi:hypothetical protein
MRSSCGGDIKWKDTREQNRTHKDAIAPLKRISENRVRPVSLNKRGVNSKIFKN